MIEKKSVNDWVEEITAWGASKGWDKPALCEQRGGRSGPPPLEVFAPQGVDTSEVLAKVALIHTELSEAVEAAREGKYVAYEKDGKPEGFVVELADSVIRAFHLAGLLGLDLGAAIEMKMAANRERPYRHGGKLA